jgi:cytochrome c-type biogenesis protein CcmH/NrfG
VTARLSTTAAIAAVTVLGLLGPAPAAAAARRDRTVSGDVIKAARFLQTARLDDARLLLADLEKRAPGTAEVKWLAAELAFQSGDYAGAIKQLDKLPDTAVDGMVGQTRKLAAGTLAVTEAFVEVRSPKGHFLIRHAPGPDAAIAGLAGEVLDAAWEAIGDDLGLRPADAIRVELVGAPAELAKLSPLTEADIETTGTIALSKYNKLMVVSPRATIFGYPWMDTLAHEYTHLIVSRLSHDTVPVWLQEGLARFEQTRWRTQPELRLSATEQALLASALKKGRLITLDEMHPSMAKLPSQDAAALAYAEVYTLVAWLHGKLGYKGIRDVVIAQRDGKSARRAVAEALGLTWAAVEKTWHGSLRTQPAAVAAPPRAGKPIRFGKGGTDSENVGLEQVSARARKHARLGGILRVRRMLEAAAVEYEKALAIGGPEPFVAAKLARTLVEIGLAAPAPPAPPAPAAPPAPKTPIDRAIELATPLAAADPQDASVAVTLGMARMSRREWPQVIAAFEQALRVSPFDPTTRCGLAEAYGKTSDPRAARERAACDQLKH